jgi:hypothetical protein
MRNEELERLEIGALDHLEPAPLEPVAEVQVKTHRLAETIWLKVPE